MSEPRRVSPEEAFALMGEGYTYVDVRSSEEFDEGHPEGAINVSFDLYESSEKQAAFVSRMRRAFSTDQKLCLGCQAGIRSLAAARLLLRHGFTNVVEQRAGWDGARGDFGELTEPGWRRAGLPAKR